MWRYDWRRSALFFSWLLGEVADREAIHGAVSKGGFCEPVVGALEMQPDELERHLAGGDYSR